MAFVSLALQATYGISVMVELNDSLSPRPLPLPSPSLTKFMENQLHDT